MRDKEDREAGPHNCQEENVWVRVLDVSGRRLAVVVDGRMPPELHAVAWSATGLPSGTYA